MSDVLAQQKRYYAERAPEYDDWWYRRGRYELEPAALARWQADAAEVEAELERLVPRGSILELAAGTGIWTRKLAGLADRVQQSRRRLHQPRGRHQPRRHRDADGPQGT